MLLKIAIKEVRPSSVLLADGSESAATSRYGRRRFGADAGWTAGLPRGKGGRIEVGADLRVTGRIGSLPSAT